MNKKYFGTDGIRGNADEFLTNNFVEKIGLAYANLITRNFNENKKHSILIGYDTRESCNRISDSLINSFKGFDIDVIDLGVTPTPSVAFLTKELNASGSIMISASHNHYLDNGIKFFSKNGTKNSTDFEEAMEILIDSELESLPLHPGFSYQKYHNSNSIYSKFLTSKFKNTIKNSDKKIFIDCANGATFIAAQEVFNHFGFNNTFFFTNPNGKNINENCGSTSPEFLSQSVYIENADVGFAFDGDGDRLVVIDNKGNVIDGDELLYLFAVYLKDTNTLKNSAIASTIVSNIGLELSLNKVGISLKKTRVGDKYVAAELIDSKLNFGGENSGHIIFGDEQLTGDGILSALFFCSLLEFYGDSLDDVRSSYEKLAQHSINFVTNDKTSWENDSFIQENIHNIEKELRGRGRVLIRPSGTEPVIRILVECGHSNEAKNFAQQLHRIFENYYSKKILFEK